jgi:hypothetical protein
MIKKILKRSRYIFFELLGAVVYGIILYYFFTYFAEISLLHAYFGSLALMIFLIVIEECSMRLFESDRYLKKLSERKRAEKYISSNVERFNYTFSVKTSLYLFYVFLLIFSKVIEYNPALVSEDINAFILANNYSILLLIALDRFVGQSAKDRERYNKLTEKIKKYFPDNKTE